MKKRLFSALFTAFLASSLVAQNRSTCEEQIDSVRFRMVEKGGKLAVEWGSGGADFRRVRHSNLMFEKVALVDADLVFWFAPRAVGDGLLADFSISILEQKSRRDRSPRADRWADLPPSDEKEIKGFRRRAFLDATESGLLLGGEYVLFLKSSLRTNIDCARKPTFSIQKQLPSYFIGLLGAAMLVKAARPDDNYKRYEKAWRNGEPLTSEVRDFYKKSVNARRFYTGVGLGLFSGGAIWAVGSYRNTQRLKKQFCRCCGDCGEAEKKPKLSLRELRPATEAFGFAARFEF